MDKKPDFVPYQKLTPKGRKNRDEFYERTKIEEAQLVFLGGMRGTGSTSGFFKAFHGLATLPNDELPKTSASLRYRTGVAKRGRV